MLTSQLFRQSRRLSRFGRLLSNGGERIRPDPREGPGLEDFLRQAPQLPSTSKGPSVSSASEHPYLPNSANLGGGRRVFLETYGCQMNVSDMEIVRAILLQNDFVDAAAADAADVVLIMTCAIREGAEQKIRERIRALSRLRVRKGLRASELRIGILGCMAERLKTRLLDEEPLVDLVAGPDAYRDLPRLLSRLGSPADAVNVLLSLDETYADIAPVRRDPDGVSSFVSIMRGCDNLCTYCIVPFTRGRERSRPIDSILRNVTSLAEQGVKEIMLLGQNVNSYRDLSESTHFGPGLAGSAETSTVPGFKTVYKPKVGGRRFADLLDAVSLAVPEVRIRFTSPHPKDFPPQVLSLMASRANICAQVHLPAQSGDNATLEAMGRGYTVEAYLDLVASIRAVVGPSVCFTSDFIAGFCGETEAAHDRTLQLLRAVKYDFAYCFPYSLREKTRAHRRLLDDVPTSVKNRRADELISTFREEALKLHTKLIGSTQLVLVAGTSKRSSEELEGRSDGGTKVIFPKIIPGSSEVLQVGQYVAVQVMTSVSSTPSFANS